MSERQSNQLRILTYNIHKGIGGVDRRYDIQRIVEVIRHYDPDIALLQEVDHGAPRSRYDRQVRLLSRELGLEHRLYQPNVLLKQGHYGNAILSRFPLFDTHNLNLRIPPKKRRRALIAKARLRIGELHRTLLVCNTHLGLAGFERTVQIKRILSYDRIVHLHHDTPAIVGGDFNDVWSSLGRRLMIPAGFRCAVGDTKTFPAALPMRGLDAIYYRGDLKLVSRFSGHTKLARQASDHLPIVVDFEVGKAGPDSSG